MRYRPAASVVVERTRSMRAELAASTVTPGMTPPDESRTTPVSEACAMAAVGMSSTMTSSARYFATRMKTSFSRCVRGRVPIGSGGPLRNVDHAAALFAVFDADHQLRCVVVLLADVLEDFGSGLPLLGVTTRPRRGVRARIVDGHFVIEGAEIAAGDPLDRVEPVGVRHAPALHPRLFIEAHRVDDQCVTVPPSNRVAEIAWRRVGG